MSPALLSVLPSGCRVANSAATGGKILGGGFKDIPLVQKTRESFDEGDAVTRPGLELELLELIESGNSFTASGRSVSTLIDELEEFQGSQLAAAAGAGKWVIPWVGGWERLYANSPGCRYLGGPQQTEVSFQGRAYRQVSQRQFVYGPGESGVTVEYLASATWHSHGILTSASRAATANLQPAYGRTIESRSVAVRDARRTSQLAQAAVHGTHAEAHKPKASQTLCSLLALARSALT